MAKSKMTTKTMYATRNPKTSTTGDSFIFYFSEHTNSTKRKYIKNYTVEWRYKVTTDYGTHTEWKVGESWNVSKGDSGEKHSYTLNNLRSQHPEAIGFYARVKANLNSDGEKKYTTGWGPRKVWNASKGAWDKSKTTYSVNGGSIATPSPPAVDFDDDNNVILSIELQKSSYPVSVPTHVKFDILKESTYDDEEGTITEAGSILGDNGSGYIKLFDVGSTLRASYSYKLSSGGIYYATAQLAILNSSGSTTGVSEESEAVQITGSGSSGGEVVLRPDPPVILSAEMISSGVMSVSWSAVSGMSPSDQYTVQYSTKKDLIAGGQTASIGGEATRIEISGLTAGSYYVRIKATRSGKDSAWSDTYEKPVIVAKIPNPPFVWSLKNMAIIGEHIRLYVTHQSADESKPIGGIIAWCKASDPDNWREETLNYSDIGPDDVDYTRYFDLFVDPEIFTEEDVIIWKAKTRNIAGWSEYSQPQNINAYFPANLEIIALSVVETFPYVITLDSSPDTQNVTSISLSIHANESYETTNLYGENTYVNEGQEIFSKLYIDELDHHFIVELKPQDLHIEDGIEYFIKATVSMDSGQMASSEKVFSVELEESAVEIEAEITFDETICQASIIPTAWIYEESEEEESRDLATNVLLNVYRLNYDGSFTTIASNIVNTGHTLVSDPHMPMRNGVYRITIVDTITGRIQFADFFIDDDISATGIIIQWNERYRRNISFASTSDTEDEGQINLFGVTLLLPYNIKIQEGSNKDVELVEYIGRENPVTYYGTQKGQNGNWSAEIPKDDKETIYKLRLLSNYSGDCYIREQSGIGYWANVSVSMNMDYDSLVVPVSLNITKVDSDRI